MTRRLLDYGADAVLLECADLAESAGLLTSAADLDAVAEVVPGARTLLLRLRRPLTERERTGLLTTPGRAVGPDPDDEVRIDVDYDGADLTKVAQTLGLSPAEVVARHTAAPWTVAFCGFAPGFGYLVRDDAPLVVPRRRTPRTRVPVGAVGLAGAFSGVYPRAGPGGWQLVGRTEAVLFDVDRDPPAWLSPGRRVRFHPC